MTLATDWQSFFSLQWQRRSAPLQHICVENLNYHLDGGDDEQGGEVFHHLAVADLAVSARHPAGAGDWPGDGGIGEVDEVEDKGDSEEDEDEHEEGEDKEDGERENEITHPSHLHTLALT